MASDQDTAPYDVGVIHGRFQVLHNDHLRYLLAGKDLCRHLVVGITNPDPSLTREESADPHRSRPEANPLTYYERQALVRAALGEAGGAPGGVHGRPAAHRLSGAVPILRAPRRGFLPYHLRRVGAGEAAPVPRARPQDPRAVGGAPRGEGNQRQPGAPQDGPGQALGIPGSGPGGGAPEGVGHPRSPARIGRRPTLTGRGGQTRAFRGGPLADGVRFGPPPGDPPPEEAGRFGSAMGRAGRQRAGAHWPDRNRQGGRRSGFRGASGGRGRRGRVARRAGREDLPHPRKSARFRPCFPIL